MRRISWSEQARADVRRIDRETAMRIFAAVLRYAESGVGDVRELKGQAGELRLRVGDYRVRFTPRRHHANPFGKAQARRLSVAVPIATSRERAAARWPLSELTPQPYERYVETYNKRECNEAQ